MSGEIHLHLRERGEKVRIFSEGLEYINANKME